MVVLKNMIRVVHPGSRIRMPTFSHLGSRVQKGTQSRIPDPDPQHGKKSKFLEISCVENLVIFFWEGRRLHEG
jgi:hypothetical protein